MTERQRQEELTGGNGQPAEAEPAPACNLADKGKEPPEESSESSMTVAAEVGGEREQTANQAQCYGVTPFWGASEGVEGKTPTRKGSARPPMGLIEPYLRAYLSFPDSRYFLPLALFALLEHCWDQCFDEVPYLSVSAMVKSSGKTRVLELLKFLGGEDKAVLVEGSITVAALYTEIQAKKVILMDESERLQNPHSALRPILNGGYRRGQDLVRKIGGENRRFSIFCPKVFAQIGDVYDSLRDRSIIIEMQRTRSGARTEYVQQTAQEQGAKIAAEVARAVGERIEEIRTSYLNYHTLYSSLNFLRARDKEIWKPLFALCQVFAPARIAELNRSAIDIATLKTLPIRHFEQLREQEALIQEQEYAEQLVRDALTVIGARDRITSEDLVIGLRAIPTSPWRSYQGTGITDISLAAMLKLFSVAPRTIRFKPKGQPKATAKGYLRAHLAAAQTAMECEAPETRESARPSGTLAGIGSCSASAPCLAEGAQHM